MYRISLAAAVLCVVAFTIPALRRQVNLDDVEKQQTPLMQAAKQGDIAGIRRLLDQGADPYAVTRDGKNAMDFAVLGGVCQIPVIVALRKRVPGLKLHEPSTIGRGFELAKLRGCAVWARITE